MYERAAFGPDELVVISAAFERALSSAADEMVARPGLHPEVARRRIAIGIFSAAQVGVTDLDDLATEGLRSLDAPPEENRVKWQDGPLPPGPSFGAIKAPPREGRRATR